MLLCKVMVTRVGLYSSPMSMRVPSAQSSDNHAHLQCIVEDIGVSLRVS